MPIKVPPGLQPVTLPEYDERPVENPVQPGCLTKLPKPAVSGSRNIGPLILNCIKRVNGLGGRPTLIRMRLPVCGSAILYSRIQNVWPQSGMGNASVIGFAESKLSQCMAVLVRVVGNLTLSFWRSTMKIVGVVIRPRASAPPTLYHGYWKNCVAVSECFATTATVQ